MTWLRATAAHAPPFGRAWWLDLVCTLWWKVMREGSHGLGHGFLKRNRLVLKSASTTLAGTMVGRAVTMLSVLGTAGLLGAAGYGAYAFILSTVGLIAGVGQLGIGPVVSREMARAPQDE